MDRVCVYIDRTSKRIEESDDEVSRRILFRVIRACRAPRLERVLSCSRWDKSRYRAHLPGISAPLTSFATLTLWANKNLPFRGYSSRKINSASQFLSSWPPLRIILFEMILNEYIRNDSTYIFQLILRLILISSTPFGKIGRIGYPGNLFSRFSISILKILKVRMREVHVNAKSDEVERKRR